MRPVAPANRPLVEQLGPRLDSVFATWSQVTEADVAADVSRVLTGNGVTDWIAAGVVPIAWLPAGGLLTDQDLTLAMKPGDTPLEFGEVSPWAIAETCVLL